MAEEKEGGSTVCVRWSQAPGDNVQLCMHGHSTHVSRVIETSTSSDGLVIRRVSTSSAYSHTCHKSSSWISKVYFLLAVIHDERKEGGVE
jgi:hypothetical protein